MVECTALEMRHTRKGIGGSNPSLSAIIPATRGFCFLGRYRSLLERAGWLRGRLAKPSGQS